MASQSGDTPYSFVHRPDFHVLPDVTLPCEVNLHGTFATDRREGFGQLYYGMPGCGILRIDPDLSTQDLITIPDKLKPMNFHSTKLAEFDGQWRLFLPANNDELVVILTLDGEIDFTLSRPEFEEYQHEKARFSPTDTLLMGEELLVTDGYGSNYINKADMQSMRWSGLFGGFTKDWHEHGKFATAHGISRHHHHHHHVMISDRPMSRIEEYNPDGTFIDTHALPRGAWPCGLDVMHHDGRHLGVIGSLIDPEEGTPAPIYIIDADTFELLSTVRPQEDLGLDPVQHLHNVVWHQSGDNLYLVCQAWNPGLYFVLERVA